LELKEINRLEFNAQIWRILISEKENLIIETRDKDKKEVYYSAFSLNKKEFLWNNFQPEEKFWIGIEKIYREVIYFHKFAKPDMPAHRGIIAFDIQRKEILWEREDVIFKLIAEDKLYALEDDFYGDNILTLDLGTGKELEHYKTYELDLEALKFKAEASEDFSRYRFPEIFYNNGADPKIELAIQTIKDKKDVDIVGNFEYTLINNLFLTSYHLNYGKKMDNEFCAFDVEEKKFLLEKKLNKQIELFAADTFFVYERYLFLLKDQREIQIYTIEG